MDKEPNGYKADAMSGIGPSAKTRRFEVNLIISQQKKIEALNLRNIELEHWFHGYRTPELSMAAMMENITELKAEVAYDKSFIKATDDDNKRLNAQLNELKGEIGCLQRSLNASNKHTIKLEERIHKFKHGKAKPQDPTIANQMDLMLNWWDTFKPRK